MCNALSEAYENPDQSAQIVRQQLKETGEKLYCHVTSYGEGLYKTTDGRNHDHVPPSLTGYYPLYFAFDSIPMMMTALAPEALASRSFEEKRVAFSKETTHECSNFSSYQVGETYYTSFDTTITTFIQDSALNAAVFTALEYRESFSQAALAHALYWAVLWADWAVVDARTQIACNTLKMYAFRSPRYRDTYREDFPEWDAYMAIRIEQTVKLLREHADVVPDCNLKIATLLYLLQPVQTGEQGKELRRAFRGINDRVPVARPAYEPCGLPHDYREKMPNFVSTLERALAVEGNVAPDIEIVGPNDVMVRNYGSHIAREKRLELFQSVKPILLEE